MMTQIAVEETRTGQNGKIWLSRFAQTLLRVVLMSWPQARCITVQPSHLVNKLTLHVFLFCDFIYIDNLHNRAVQTTLLGTLLDHTPILGVPVILANWEVL
jgi:hypothetical protein